MRQSLSILVAALLYPVSALADPVEVSPDNFCRAESDLYFKGIVGNGGFARFDHTREPTPLDKQTVIRLNRDTLYSAAVFDLDAGPVTITLPDSGDRFMSLQTINENHYVHGVFYEPGRVKLTREEVGTRYVAAAVRTFADPADPQDIAAANALQDALSIEQAATGEFTLPQWDPESQALVRSALLSLATTLPDSTGMYGTPDEVEPVRHLIGCAFGWGANPVSEAIYLNVVPEANDGETVYRLEVGDVPVEAFWSVSVYNEEGYFEPNPFEAYTLNNITAGRDADGMITIQFGGCDDSTPNCLPTPPDWNYMVRLYRPSDAILSGDWQFPTAEPVK